MKGGERRRMKGEKWKIGLMALLILTATLIATVNIQPAESSESGLVGYWNFDEGTGTIAHDSSGNNNHGTLMNGPTWSRWPNSVIGDYALNFDGVDDYVLVLDSDSLDLRDAFTIAMWFKPKKNIYPGFKEYYVLLCKWHGIGDQWRTGYGLTLNAYSLGKLGVLMGFGNAEWSYLFSKMDTWNSSVFYHVAVTYDRSLPSGNVKFYIDGTLDSEYDEKRPLAVNTLNLTINMDPFELWHPGNTYFPGIIDDVRVYNRALSEEEILGLSRGVVVQRAISAIGANYTYGAKGWHQGVKRFLNASELKQKKYWFWYYNADTNKTENRTGSGTDCSGLVFWAYNFAYRAEKYNIKYTTKDGRITYHNPVHFEGAQNQYKINCRKITKEELQPGDLLFFDANKKDKKDPDHVAMFVGGPYEYTYNVGGQQRVFRYNVVESTSWGDHIITVSFYNSADETLTTLQPSNGDTRILKVDYYGRVKFPVVAFYKEGKEVFTIAKSPVDLEVTDPDGTTITYDLKEDPDMIIREVEGMTYEEFDIDGNGDLDDIIIIWERKIGDYLIYVKPESDAAMTDTYTLEVWADNQTYVLAKDIKISDIPTQPYIIRSSETGISPIIPSPPGVGGIVIPVDKFALLAPYIGLTSTIIVAAVATVIYVKRVKRRKEKQ
jgi:hypothetical protein